MWIQHQLVLLSGTAGSGVSTVARLLADSAPAEVYSWGAPDAAERRERHRAAAAALAESVLPDQLDPSALWAVGALPLVDELCDWLDLLEAFEWRSVVVDLGDLASLRRFLAVPDAVLTMLDALMTPRFALAHRPVDTGATGGLQPVEWLRAAMERANAVVSKAALWLVTDPDRGEEVLSVLPLAALHGLWTDAVIVNKVPRGRDDWPRAWAKPRRAAAKGLRERIAPIPCPRLPLVIGSEFLVSRDMAEALWDELSPQVFPREVDGGEPFEFEGGWRWIVPLPDPLAQEVNVGRIGDGLLVQVGGQRRILPLPAVLRRCIPEWGEVNSRSLTVHFAPDPEQWRAP